jgi:transposase-like protein
MTSSVHRDSHDSKKQAALELVAQGHDPTLVAMQLGVAKSTLLQWLDAGGRHAGGGVKSAGSAGKSGHAKPTGILGMRSSALKRLQKMAQTLDPHDYDTPLPGGGMAVLEELQRLREENAHLKKQLDAMAVTLQNYAENLALRLKAEADDARKLAAGFRKQPR